MDTEGHAGGPGDAVAPLQSAIVLSHQHDSYGFAELIFENAVPAGAHAASRVFGEAAFLKAFLFSDQWDDAGFAELNCKNSNAVLYRTCPSAVWGVPPWNSEVRMLERAEATRSSGIADAKKILPFGPRPFMEATHYERPCP